MATPILSYARLRRRRPRRWRPRNAVAIVAAWIGGLGQAALLLYLAPAWTFGHGLSNTFAGSPLDPIAFVAAVLMPSGVLLALTSVAIGPDRRTSAAWAVVQITTVVGLLWLASLA